MQILPCTREHIPGVMALLAESSGPDQPWLTTQQFLDALADELTQARGG